MKKLNKTNPNRVYEIRKGKDVIYLRHEDIMSLESDGSYTKLEDKDGIVYEVAKNLKQCLKELDNPDFIRTHHRYAVYKTYIARCINNRTKIKLINGDELPISRRYKCICTKLLREKTGDSTK